MANKKISEGVGKKIVEALKKQSEIEINTPASNENQNDFENLTNDLSDAFENEGLESAFGEDVFNEDNLLDNLASDELVENVNIPDSAPNFSDSSTQPQIQKPTQPASQQFMNYQQPTANDNFISELDSFEIPSNIAVLKKLITQLPSGVTRHTGAQIIKQTMEALGISMKSVLQEAQQVQDGLNNSATECFATIQEYKKQIMTLEKQAQNHQKQYAALNELISLFIQTGV